MSEYKYKIEDFSFANYNRKAIKVYDSAETKKEGVSQIIHDAVNDFLSKNKDIDYFGLYYYPTYEDYEHAIQLCYFLEINKKVKEIDFKNIEEINKRLVWNKDFKFFSKLYMSEKTPNFYQLNNVKGVRCFLEHVYPILLDLENIRNLDEISEGTFFYSLLEDWIFQAEKIDFGMGKLNDIIEKDFMGLVTNLSNIKIYCLSNERSQDNRRKYTFKQQLEMAIKNFDKSIEKLNDFINKSLK
jgi:hypothetical protein